MAGYLIIGNAILVRRAAFSVGGERNVRSEQRGRVLVLLLEPTLLTDALIYVWRGGHLKFDSLLIVIQKSQIHSTGLLPIYLSVCLWKYLYGQGSCARYDISHLANDSASIHLYLASIQSIIPLNSCRGP